MSHYQNQIDEEIRSKGLNSKRSNTGKVETTIVDEQYYTFPHTRITICLLTLSNGDQVLGNSQLASPTLSTDELYDFAKYSAKTQILAY